MSDRSLHHCYVAAGVFMLMIGGMVYLLCRPNTVLVNHVVYVMRLDNLFVDMRQWMQLHPMSNLLVYCLPAGLWAASYVTLVHAFSSRLTKTERLIFASMMPLAGIVSELLQGVGFIPGTFDPIDIVCYATPYLLYMMVLL